MKDKHCSCVPLIIGMVLGFIVSAYYRNHYKPSMSPAIYRQMAKDVDNHRLFYNKDLVDQRALLLMFQPRPPEIEEIVYKEFRASSLEKASNWCGIFNMAADYAEMKGDSP